MIMVPSAKRPSFVREIPKQTIKTLDLVDVVAGGDGFSGRRNRGIDPTTAGQPISSKPSDDCSRRRRQVSSCRGDAVCGRRVHSRRPYGPVQIDSAGHIFDGFPPIRP